MFLWKFKSAKFDEQVKCFDVLVHALQKHDSYIHRQIKLFFVQQTNSEAPLHSALVQLNTHFLSLFHANVCCQNRCK